MTHSWIYAHVGALGFPGVGPDPPNFTRKNPQEPPGGGLGGPGSDQPVGNRVLIEPGGLPISSFRQYQDGNVSQAASKELDRISTALCWFLRSAWKVGLPAGRLQGRQNTPNLTCLESLAGPILHILCKLQGLLTCHTPLFMGLKRTNSKELGLNSTALL